MEAEFYHPDTVNTIEFIGAYAFAHHIFSIMQVRELAMAPEFHDMDLAATGFNLHDSMIGEKLFF